MFDGEGRKKKRKKTYMELATELPLGTELDVDTLVEAEPDQIQRLLHRALFLARHSRRFSFSLCNANLRKHMNVRWSDALA